MHRRYAVGLANSAAAAATVLTVVAAAAELQRPSLSNAITAIVLVAALSIPMVGAAAVRSAPRNTIGWLLLASGICLPLCMAAEAAYRADPAVSVWVVWLYGWPATPAASTVPLLVLQLYPNGRPLSRRWIWLVWLGAIVFVTQVLGELFAPLIWGTSVPNPTALPGVFGSIADGMAAGIVLLPVMATLSAAVATIRWRRGRRQGRGGDTAAQLGLIVPAGWLVAASWWLCVVVTSLTNDSSSAELAELLGILAVGVAGWIGIRRFGLFDARAVISRGIVAVLLGLVVLGVYLVVALVAENLLAGPVGGIVAVLTAVLVALPLWRLLQRAVDRLLYGDRDEPGRALRRLGARVADAADPEQLLPDALAIVRDALRLPGAEIVSGTLRVGAVSDGASIEVFPLVFAGERIGDMRVMHREPGETFRPSERAALGDLAAQLTGAVRAVALIEDLRRSRERLVSERERERRRITRDLHDGLGARLGGLVLGTQRARRAIADDPRRAEDQLDEVTAQVRDALDEVRRLVYELRPPALDELGLIGAVEEQARRLNGIEVVAPIAIGPLPAAVEVAAYRIAVEAMTNINRHAPDGRGTVLIERTERTILIEVADTGPGLPEAFRAGVGIGSMRERAGELDGDLSIGPRADGGTVVRALLPIGEA